MEQRLAIIIYESILWNSSNLLTFFWKEEEYEEYFQRIANFDSVFCICKTSINISGKEPNQKKDPI